MRNLFRSCAAVLFLLMGWQVFGQAAQDAQPSPAAFQAVFVSVKDDIDATGPSLVIKKYREIKLISPAAIDRFSTLEFPTTPNQQITVNSINIVGPDGISKPVSLDQVKEIPPFEKIPSLNSFKILGIQMKDIAPGSTLEYSITETDAPMIAGEYWQDIPLQETEPVPILKEQVSLTEITGKQADVRSSKGTLPAPQVTTAQGTTTRTWTFEKIPPYIPQMYMPSPMDLIPRLQISTLKGWGKFADAAMSQYFISTDKPDLDKVVNDLTKNVKSQDEKMIAIYGFVAMAIRSLPASVSDLGKIPHPLNLDETLKEGFGDSRDKAALLSELFQKLGLTCDMTLIAPINNGTISTDFPMPPSLTRAVVKVDDNGKTYWFDPYIETTPFGYLPPEDQGRPALDLPSGNFETTPIYPPSANLRSVKVIATLHPDGTLDENLELKAEGADALGIRSVLKNIEDKERQQVLASLAYQVVNSTNPPSIKDVTTGALGDLASPVSLGLKFEAKNFATPAGDLTFFSMPINVLDYLKPVLSQPSPRKYPFVLGNTVNQTELLELTLPAGYKLRTLPRPVKVVNSAGSYKAAFTRYRNKLIFESTLILDKIEYQPSEFDALKTMVADRAKIENAKLVLEKTGTSASKLKRKISLAR